MNLVQAKVAFFAERHPPPEPYPCVTSLELLCNYFAALLLADISPEQLRQFLSVWFLEETIAHPTSSNQPASFPDAQTMLACLTDFFTWAGKQPVASPAIQEAHLEPVNPTITEKHLAVLQNLQKTLPRAIAITRSLSDFLAKRGGAFTFPEFLTSFEEGGQSAYDIGGASSETSAIEGYFKILSVDGPSVEAEETISERQISPILFPHETAALLDVGYIINLELIYLQDNWQIVNCGFAYPPDTEV